MGSVERWRADTETTADCLEQGDATGSHLSGSRFRPTDPETTRHGDGRCARAVGSDRRRSAGALPV